MLHLNLVIDENNLKIKIMHPMRCLVLFLFKGHQQIVE